MVIWALAQIRTKITFFSFLFLLESESKPSWRESRCRLDKSITQLSGFRRCGVWGGVLISVSEHFRGHPIVSINYQYQGLFSSGIWLCGYGVIVLTNLTMSAYLVEPFRRIGSAKHRTRVTCARKSKLYWYKIKNRRHRCQFSSQLKID